MTDREMLEFAAKAAGMYVLPMPWPDADGWFYCMQHGFPGLHFRKFGKHPNEHNTEPWRPITDDGDALRLAVKLGMGLLVCTHFNRSAANVDDGEYLEVNHGADPYAATRLAITRAAAEIGRNLP